MNELRKNMTCIDLNSKTLKFSAGEAGHVRREIHIFATHGLYSLAPVTNMHQSVQWRLQSKNV